MALLTALLIAALILASVIAYQYSGSLIAFIRRYFSLKRSGFRAKKMTDSECQLIQQLFFKTVFSLLGYMARVSGQLDKAEVRLVYVYMPAMQLDSGEKDYAMRIFAAAIEPQFQLKSALDGFKRVSEKKSHMAEMLLVYLINLARTYSLLAKSELEVLNEAADGLGISNNQFNSLLRTTSSQNTFSHFRKNAQTTKAEICDGDLLAVACDALGVSAQSDQREIHEAYRKLLNQYHPVRLRELCLPNFMLRLAADHIKRIQLAYDCIRKFREGF
ncbi:MAG TPA: co-chaperone DjlA [Cellvibrio sp.]|nr:co-chaperone DjlA [Cellvibrio sp.]